MYTIFHSLVSEFQIARPHDGARFEQLISGLAAKDNPVQLFRYGNLVSLKDNVAEDKLYEELHKFRQRHYSAHRMTLALQVSSLKNSQKTKNKKKEKKN